MYLYFVSYSVLIAYAYKKVGQQVFIEKAVSEERRVDVLVSNGKQTAIEVELGLPWWHTIQIPPRPFIMTPEALGAL
jgi:hypothetical protein